MPDHLPNRPLRRVRRRPALDTAPRAIASAHGS
jgi:hypothetical protein